MISISGDKWCAKVLHLMILVLMILVSATDLAMIYLFDFRIIPTCLILPYLAVAIYLCIYVHKYFGEGGQSE